MTGSSSLIDVNAVTAKPGDADYENQVFLFQHNWNNGVVDKNKKGNEQYWAHYLQNSLANDPFFTPEEEKPENILH